jgi:membrane protein YdbS with pleckstrin-like domain
MEMMSDIIVIVVSIVKVLFYIAFICLCYASWFFRVVWFVVPVLAFFYFPAWGTVAVLKAIFFLSIGPAYFNEMKRRSVKKEKENAEIQKAIRERNKTYYH